MHKLDLPPYFELEQLSDKLSDLVKFGKRKSKEKYFSLSYNDHEVTPDM